MLLSARLAHETARRLSTSVLQLSLRAAKYSDFLIEHVDLVKLSMASLDKHIRRSNMQSTSIVDKVVVRYCLRPKTQPMADFQMFSQKANNVLNR